MVNKTLNTPHNVYLQVLLIKNSVLINYQESLCQYCNKILTVSSGFVQIIDAASYLH